MIERTTLLPLWQEPKYLGELALKKEQLLFFDIETTGLKADASSLYLIGCCFYENDGWNLVQWFADDYESEKKIIFRFIECMKEHPLLVQYNGEVFDLKYLGQKAKSYGMEFPTVIKQSEAYENVKDRKEDEYKESFGYFPEKHRISVDLYHHMKKLKGICRLKSLKLADISTFFGFERKDRFSGGELLYTYSDYMKLRILSRCRFEREKPHSLPAEAESELKKDAAFLPDFDAGRTYSDYDYYEFHKSLHGKKEEELLEELMLHNFEDIISMLPIFSVTRTTELLYYPCLLWDREKLLGHLFWEENGSEKILHAKELVFPLKKPLVYESYTKGGEGFGGRLTVTPAGFTLYSHTIRMELKLFYPDYRNYYYLPIEDYAVHKSIGAYLEKGRSQKAKPDNAYTRHEDEYILLLDKKDVIKFIFKQKGLSLAILLPDYHSNCAYVRFSDISEPSMLMEYLKIFMGNL